MQSATMQSATPGAPTSVHLPVRHDWFDRRREAIIEPELPIVDPHHHLVDRPETGRYLLPDLLADTDSSQRSEAAPDAVSASSAGARSGHNITATVYLEWLSMYRAQGPAELRPVGEIEFANGVAAMAGSGTYGETRVCAGIVGYADLTLGAGRKGAGGDDRGRRRPVPRDPLYHRLASRPGCLGFADHPPRGAIAGPEGARGLCPAGAARSQL